MTIFYDRYVKSYTTKIDPFAAPERYYQLSYFYNGIDGKQDDECIEVWKLRGSDNNAYIRYDINMLKTPNIINNLRDKIAKEHSVELVYMTEWIVPKRIYMEIEQMILEKETEKYEHE